MYKPKPPKPARFVWTSDDKGAKVEIRTDDEAKTGCNCLCAIYRNGKLFNRCYVSARYLTSGEFTLATN